jgi:hypothetical protein
MISCASMRRTLCLDTEDPAQEPHILDHRSWIFAFAPLFYTELLSAYGNDDGGLDEKKEAFSVHNHPERNAPWLKNTYEGSRQR